MTNKRVKDRIAAVLKYSLLLIIVTIIIIPAVSSAQSEELTVRVGVYDNPPKVYSDENGAYIGFFPEIIELIAENESWEIEYVFGNWSTCLERLESGDIDVMVDVAYSEERTGLYDFNNEMVFNNWGVVYTPPDSTIESLTDLEGKKIAVMKGSIHTDGERGIKALTESFDTNCTFVELSSYREVLSSIDSGSVDAGVVNRLFGESEKNKFNIERTNIIFNPIELRFALHKNATLNTVLIEGIDRNLKEMKEDRNSQYYILIDKYLLERNGQQETQIPEWVLPSLGVAFIVIILLFIVSAAFKREVNKKTEDIKEANRNLEAEIKKQKDTEEKLRESEGRFKAIASNTPDYIMMQDRELRYLAVVNPPMGLKEEEMIGKTDHSLLPEEEAERLTSIKREVMDTGKVQHLKSDLASSKEGETEFFDGTYVPIYDSDGTVNGIIGYFRNVTERQQAENELREYRDQLERIVEERTSDLQKTSDELKDANIRLQELDRLKSMFIASTSHELRTPLNSIIGFTSVLLEGWSGEVNAEQKEQLEIVLTSGKHLLSLINDVIDISKIEAGKLEVYIQEINLGRIVDEAASLVKKDAEEKGLSLTVDTPNISMYSDRRRLLQCIINLLSNAVKYSEKGDIVLKIKENNDHVDISVSDTGIGMKEEELEKLFKPFVRLDSHLKDATSGTGLGLYLTDKLTREVLKGTIDVTSEYGKGTTVTLHIPIRTKAEVPI